MEGNKLFAEMQGNEDKREKIKGKPPEFVNRNEGTAVWINKDKNGNEYLSIDVMGGKINLKAFRNIPKDESRPPEAGLKGEFRTRT